MTLYRLDCDEPLDSWRHENGRHWDDCFIPVNDQLSKVLDKVCGASDIVIAVEIVQGFDLTPEFIESGLYPYDDDTT